MKVGVHKNYSNKLFTSTRIIIRLLEENNIDYKLLCLNDPNFFEEIQDLDIFIFKFSHTSDELYSGNLLISLFENISNIRTFPNLNSIWHFDDKIKQYYLLKSLGFPVINTHIFWNKKDAKQWIKDAKFPLVFKLKGGASAANVLKLKSKLYARYLINKSFGRGILSERIPYNFDLIIKDFTWSNFLFKAGKRVKRMLKGQDTNEYWGLHKNYVYFQDFIDGNPFDVRVYVIGQRAFAGNRYNRKNDFRASGSKEKDKNPNNIDLQFIKLAFEMNSKLKMQAVAFDFIYDANKKPLIIEMSYAFPSYAFAEYPGYWDENLVWHEGKSFPEFYILKDLLEISDFKNISIVEKL